MMENNIQTVREELGKLISFYGDKNLFSLSYHKVFDKTAAILERAQREFDANLFFILMFGPLKAGKSTLTNLLAREHVSPTGFGIETTLRPSIILKSRTKEYFIDVYEAVDPRDDQGELFDMVIDNLRGISDIKAAKTRIRKVTIPLTEQNVKDRLIGNLDTEPLITVLNVPGGNLVTENIALIDMPGLDGIKSNWEESVVHKWILKRADFLIFVQSSMAALNKATFEFLKDAYLGSRKPPLWLVQNVIDAKYWRSEEDKRRDTNTQQQRAKEQILSLLGIAEDLRSTAINLGKAADGVDFSNENLLNESKFMEFENDLKEIMNVSRVNIQQENSIKGVVEALRNCKAEFRNSREELLELDEEYKNKMNKLAEPKNIFGSMCKMIRPEMMKKDFKDLVEELIGAWSVKCNALFADDELNKRLTPDRSGEEWKQELRARVDEINNSRKNDYLEGTAKYKSGLQELVKKKIAELQDNDIARLNGCLSELGIRSFEKEFNFVPDAKPEDFRISDSIEELVKKTARGVKLFKKKAPERIKTICDNIETQYEDYCKKMLKDMTSQLSLEFDSWIQHGYRDEYEKYLNDQTGRMEDEIRQKRGVIEDSLGYIEQLEKMCDTLEKTIQE